MLILRQGFSLMELLLALAVGSLLLLGTTQFYPQIYRQSLLTERRFLLDQRLLVLLQQLEKEIQRAGFCQGSCQGTRLRIEPECLVVAYDLNHNGIWELNGASSDYFAYRLSQNAIETHRGVQHCGGNGWERLTDPAEIRVTEFSLQPITDSSASPSAARQVILIRLSAESQIKPVLQQTQSRYVVVQS